MGHFIDDSDLVYVTLDGVSETPPAEGVEYLALRPAITVADKAALEAAAMRLTDGVVEPDVQGYLLALWEVSFVGWHLVGRNGQPVPFSRAAVRKLSSEDALVEAATQEFFRRNPTLRQRRARNGSTI